MKPAVSLVMGLVMGVFPILGLALGDTWSSVAHASSLTLCFLVMAAQVGEV